MSTVLIVDDDRTTRETYAALLRLEGLECLPAEDGRAALLAASTKSPDLGLIDLHLQNESGLDVVRDLRAKGIGCPLVIVTRFPTFDTCYAAATANADGYVDGPLFLEDFMAVVKRGLARRLPVHHPRYGSPSAGQGDATPKTPSEADGRVDAGRAPRNEALVRALLGAVDDDPAASIAEYAAKLDVSESHLRHVVAEHTRLSPSEIRDPRRLDLAAMLLRLTRTRISDITRKVGLGPGSLIKPFRRRFGVTPSDYRASYGAQAAAPSPAAATDKK